jgi:osmotically-inducible protein OsmY
MGEGSSSQSARVTPLAATTEGVDRVFSYISVDPDLIPADRPRKDEFAGAHHADRWISSRLLRLLRFDTTVNAHSIEVEALEAKAILSGTVTSSAERSVAGTTAAQIAGRITRS